jgi:hypothetical protein
VHHRTVSSVKTAESASDTRSYIVLRGSWCNIIVLNVHATSEEKSSDSDDSFYEESEISRSSAEVQYENSVNRF